MFDAAKWMNSLVRHALIGAFCAAFFVLAFATPLSTAKAEELVSPPDDEIVMLDDNAALLPSDEMNESRGAAGTALLSNQTLAATTTGNVFTVAGDLTTGSISFGDSLSGLGFGSYVMNTGNNTAISSAVSLNVQILATP